MVMADDKEILREIWEGKLPVCFQLASEEMQTVSAPDPYYVMIPRMSYLPLVMDKVKKHFNQHVNSDSQEKEMWLDYNGQPVKWHYPVGLLYDMLVSDNALPWNLTVHFDRFPESELIHCRNRECVESYFMSSIKEADALKHRGQVISGMQKKDHNQLWLGLQNDKFDQFWAVNRKLMEPSGEEMFKYIPFRCYVADRPFIQHLMRPANSEGEKTTLKDLLKEILPNSYENARVVTHGIEPPLDTPLQWMSEHLSYPDNFLHLCIML